LPQLRIFLIALSFETRIDRLSTKPIIIIAFRAAVFNRPELAGERPDRRGEPGAGLDKGLSPGLLLAYANYGGPPVPRPLKCRLIGQEPLVRFFKPRGIPLSGLEEVGLTVDEFEAIRLADLKGLYQEQAARKMKISRQTFGNTLASAHRKLAEAIVLGKAVRIEGGVYAMEGERTFRCSACGHEWTIDAGAGRPAECPRCRSPRIGRGLRNEEGGRFAKQTRKGTCRKGDT
jgi:predicted DNA-binding protein (UPF0251 family)